MNDKGYMTVSRTTWLSTSVNVTTGVRATLIAGIVCIGVGVSIFNEEIGERGLLAWW